MIAHSHQISKRVDGISVHLPVWCPLMAGEGAVSGFREQIERIERIERIGSGQYPFNPLQKSVYSALNSGSSGGMTSLGSPTMPTLAILKMEASGSL